MYKSAIYVGKCVVNRDAQLCNFILIYLAGKLIIKKNKFSMHIDGDFNLKYFVTKLTRKSKFNLAVLRCFVVCVVFISDESE